jgi:adenine-specific DNA-methyltransferase
MGIIHDNKSITNISLWQTKLGLLPVPLYANKNDKQFVLLNGNRGNFCLDLLENSEPIENRNRAWSSDVSYYITLEKKLDNLLIQTWNSPNPQTFPVKRVLDDLNGFHRLLEEQEPKSQQDIVKHVIRVFRSLRNQLGNNFDGQASLKVFLSLLACATENKDRSKINNKKWGLSAEAIDLAENINQAAWDRLISELIEENFNGLKPNLSLMLRHASGKVFQEAHYEAIFIHQEQLRLFGLPSEPIKLGKESAGVGLHFTPPALARTLVEEALFSYGNLAEQKEIKIFDPACGSGEFLRESLRQLRLKEFAGKIKLVGWDVSEAACDMAKFVLAWECRGFEKNVVIDIQCRDSLAKDSNWSNDSDIIIMNPPFVSWKKMSSGQRSVTEHSLGRIVNYRPDLSSIFVWKASQSLTKKGILATIVPASFLDSRSNEPIRQKLGEVLEAKLVARLGSHILFSTAFVDAALYIGSTEKTRTNILAFWADYRFSSTSEGLRSLRKIRNSSENVLPVVEDGYSIYAVSEIEENTNNWSPRPYESILQFNILSRRFPTVETLFDVKQGVSTGKNDAFIISKEYFDTLPKNERKYFRPAAMNKSIKYGFLSKIVYVFYPYGENSIENEDVLKAKVKKYYNDILVKYKKELSERQRINPNAWWHLAEHRTWQETVFPKLISTHFGDVGSFAWDETGEYVVVQGYAWLFKPTEKFDSLSQELSLAYLAIQNSPLFGELLAAVSNHMDGGQWNLSKRYVNKIPIPNLMEANFNSNIIKELTSYGKKIHAGKFGDDTTLNELVRTIYQVDRQIY